MDPIEVHLIIERSAALKDNAEMWVNRLGKTKDLGRVCTRVHICIYIYNIAI